MSNMVKVSAFKAHLSSHLARVRKGATVVIADRDTPIASVIPFETKDDFIVEEAELPVSSLQNITARSTKRIDVVALLRETRGDR